jgi:Mg2+/citrate symporter
MSFWTAIVVIVAILAVAEVLKAKHRARIGRTESDAEHQPLAQREDPALKREVEELRERVKVLERIATDGRDTRLLSDEIEKLRDK